MRPALHLTIVSAAMLAACVVSPLPEPPPLSPIVPSDIEIGQCACDGALQLDGLPGSVPPGALVWLANLDEPYEPVTTIAAADGSFRVPQARGNVGATFRFQVRLDGRRSVPVDAIVPAGGALLPVSHPLGDCLVIDPEHELELDPVLAGESTRDAIIVRNRCADPIALTVRLRAPAPSFVVGTIGPTLDPGGSAPLEIELTPATAGVHEEVVLIETSAPAVDRRAVNIRGQAN